MSNIPPPSISLPRLLIKSLLLFLLCNLAFSVINPLPSIAKISAYNSLLPGRTRLPYGDRPDLAYNLSLYSMEAMFASHEIAGVIQKPDEYRVILIGDSSTWGFLLKPNETLSAYLNQAGLTSSDGRNVHVYNLGYPTMSLTKDLFILSQGIKYHPDLIIWLVTLESFPDNKQLDSPIVQNNPPQVKALIENFHLDLQAGDARFASQSFWERSIIGQRRPLADIIRLQFYGILWAATGIDQYYPEEYSPPQSDLEADFNFHELTSQTPFSANLALETLEAGTSLASGTPILFVNEPIYISQGKNSDIRYNFFYPKWAYDQYRTIMTTMAQENGWYYLDLWDIIPNSEFTNSAIHLSPSGEILLAEKVGITIQSIVNP